MSIQHEFEARLNAAWSPSAWQGFRVVLAVSGGADSVALARAVAALTPQSERLRLAHFHHGLRGADADADQQFVVELGRQLGLEVEVGRASATMSGDSAAEEDLRTARYEFLTTAARRWGARYLVTAHTADDQAETILHHVLRGTGLAGLAGVPRLRSLGNDLTLVRPLLGLRRADVLAYLAALDQPFRQDGTNEDRKYTRNRIRHELLPQLSREYSPAIVESLLRLGGLAADAQRVIVTLVDRLAEQCLIESTSDRVTLDCRQLAGQEPHLVRELFLSIWRRQGWPQKSMGQFQWNALAELAVGEASRSAASGEPSQAVFMLPGAIRAERCGDQMTLTATSATAAPLEIT